GRLGGRPSTIYLFRRERGDDFFEARIAPQWIPKREQLQIAVAEGTRVAHDLGKLFKREILLANPRRADRKPLNHQRPVECIFLRWQKLDRAAAFACCLLFSPAAINAAFAAAGSRSANAQSTQLSATWWIARGLFSRSESITSCTARVSPFQARSIFAQYILIWILFGSIASARSKATLAS